MTDESQELAPSEHAMRVELQAQVGRLESVIAVLKQQAANHQRNELESLEHVRTACRQRDEARRELDESNEKLAASQAEVARWSVLANDHQDAVVETRALLTERTRERDALKVRLAEEDPAINEEIRMLLEVVRPGVANVLAQEIAATINRDTSRNNGERAVALATALVAILDGDKFAAEKIAVLCAIVRTLGVALVEHRKRN